MPKYKKRHFIAIDGEAVTLEDGEHRYVMLCASTGEAIVNADGLTTVECFDWLLDLKRKHPNDTFVGFSFNYDINMMLVDVPRHVLERLWKDREADLIFPKEKMYGVEWMPNKMFTVWSDVRVTVSDVFGFFQTSFVRALADWDIGDKLEVSVIEVGKADRSSFKLEDLDGMQYYCNLECQLLVELMDALQEAMLEAGLHLSGWHGAGAVAGALLKKHKVNKHRVPDELLPPAILDATMHAYYGGRFQLLQQGHFDTIYNYDIRSAYPYEATQLPSLEGRWEPSPYNDTAEYAIWLVEWDLPSGRYVMPFPYRANDGSIYYPSRGMGWYWHNEVRAALKLHPEIEVKRGYIFHPDTIVKPFCFIPQVWEKRKQAIAQGLASQKAYKLGLNSLYGKLAQGRGYKGSTPPYRSFVWAGMITSGTRARLLELSYGHESNVIAYATDGIFFDENPRLQEGTELGELELTKVDDYYVLANGIYFAATDERVNSKTRTRGHNPKELNLTDLRDGWDAQGPEYVMTYEATRFIGLGVALMLRDFSLWRTWHKSQRKLQFDQSGNAWMRNENQLVIPGIDVTAYDKVVRWHPVGEVASGLGKEYIPKSDGYSVQTEAERLSVLELLTGYDQPQFTG